MSNRRLVGNADLTKIYSTDTEKAAFNLGAEVEDESGNIYAFIKFNDGDGDADGVAGYLVVGLDSSYPAYEGTTDMDSSTIPALRNRPLGILMAALTDGDYGFVQKSGLNKKAMLTDGGVTQGQVLYAHASTTGAVDSAADPQNAAQTVIGVALEADTSTALAIGEVMLTIP